MKRRTLTKLLLSLPGWLPMASLARSRPQIPIIPERRECRVFVVTPVLDTPLAGFDYYAGEQLWSQMAVYDELKLSREAHNPHDKNAVAVYWNDSKLGYLPRTRNARTAQLIDQGAELQARIIAMNDSYNPWERIRMEVVGLDI